MATATQTAPSTSERKLVGFHNFVRHNPFSDRFNIDKFHHLEYYCTDATNVSKRFSWGLGMQLVAKSDLSTGNNVYASYVVQSNDLTFVFTAPYNTANVEATSPPHPSFNTDETNKFLTQHGLAVKAVGIRVEDAAVAYAKCVENGAVGVLPPHKLLDKVTGKEQVISEIKMYGDTVIRWISGDFKGPALANYEPVESPNQSFGILRLDHAVSNVPHLFTAVDYLMNAIGFHEFSEFTAADVGTVDSGLNSMVMSSNNEFVLLPVNEPTFGTKRKSQIQTYLESNNGAGIQHLALMSRDVFHTVDEMRKRGHVGGFEFMPSPGPEYYARVEGRIGKGVLSPEQLAKLQELGILVDKDDKGVLLQIFTRPVGDRPTLFMEIIQRIGCTLTPTGEVQEQSGGCGGFGKGNFSELFKSIENFEKQQESAAERSRQEHKISDENVDVAAEGGDDKRQKV